MKIKTNVKHIFTTKLLKVYRKIIQLNRKNIIIKIMQNSFHLDSFFVGIEKMQFVELHKLAIEIL